MESVQKRISYLRGLVDGFGLEETSKEGRIVSEVVEILDDMYTELRTLSLRMEETESYVEAVDEDLSNLEWFVYEDEDLYEQVDDEGFVILDEGDPSYYDLDDSEDAHVYERREPTEPINPT